ncbi:hypothetical protein KA005_02295, partial [bacterium]|nr:hypothetical protein [bacterium]
MPTPVTPTEITPGLASAWTDVDVTAYVDAGNTAGVILHIVNNSVNERTWGVRKNGSDFTLTGILEDTSHTWTAVGIDGSDIFECYVSSTTDIDVYIVGYILSSEGGFFLNAADIPYQRQPTSLAWCDFDIAADTGANTAKLVFGLIKNIGGDYDHGVQCNGSTDNRDASLYGLDMRGFIIPCDSNEIFETYGSSSRSDFYVLGYLHDNTTI